MTSIDPPQLLVNIDRFTVYRSCTDSFLLFFVATHILSCILFLLLSIMSPFLLSRVRMNIVRYAWLCAVEFVCVCT